MSFFQNSVLNKYLKAQDEAAITKAYALFTAFFHDPVRQANIRNSKEEQFQSGFMNALFVNVLGYTLNPEPGYNLTTELKNETGSKKADGAILKNDKAIGVIELKGTDTKNLEKINVQAFNYKNNHTECVYVVTSNFEKLRFFINNAVEHIEFNLFTLTLPEFKVLWLCLQSDNVFAGIPAKVKEGSLLVEDQITKQLYKDYSAFRTAIWQNMLKNHPNNDQLMLFKKTQKLLDRFLFIFFAEDSGLLPPNSISRIVQRWKVLQEEDAYKPLYAIFKQFFGYINKGRKGKNPQGDIFAYNGGLFLDDIILDKIKLDDAVLHEHVMKLTNYNFQSEVDVNILGHIFENSLNEIENITAELEGQEVDKSKTKRKKDGVFYTPKYITKYIVDNTIGKLCEEKKAELKISDERYKHVSKRSKERIAALDEYRDWLLNLKICDPACGSGAFLNQALEFLIAEHQYLDELTAQYHKSPLVLSDVETQILEKNLYGVDINEESVEIAKLSLWLRTAQRGRKLTTLNNNIKCGNSLIDDPKVAGEKAFNWQKEFKEVFVEKDKRPFHIVMSTHNSRTSQRMIEYKVKKGTPVRMKDEEEVIVAQTIKEIVEEDNLNVMAYNSCVDHIHILLVCEEEEVPAIVQKMKSKSARAVNIARGITIINDDENIPREHAPLDLKEKKNTPILERTPIEYTPLEKENNNVKVKSKRGEKQHSFWSQKFSTTPINSEDQLWNTINYIENNRNKHDLHKIRDLQLIIENHCMLRSYEYAFRPEYKGGFDVVIGNPPYVRAELLGEYNEYFSKNYQVYNSASDLFAYFYELGSKIVKHKHGLMGYISNTFDKTTAGKVLRIYLTKETTFKYYVDFTEVQVFEGATTYPIILILEKNKTDNSIFNYIKIPRHKQSSLIEINIEPIIKVDQHTLNSDGWAFSSKDIFKLFNKISKFPTIRERLGKCYYGVKTALNEAFIVQEDWQISEHVKPIYEGKEIKKWHTPPSNQKLIFFESKWTTKVYGNKLSETDIIEQLTNDFPLLMEQLVLYEEKAKKRYDKGEYWWELRNCAYYDLFEKPKIIFPNLQNSNKFSLDMEGVFVNAPAVFLPSSSKALLCILNSKVVWKFLKSICVIRSGGYIEVKPQYFEQIPIPDIKNEKIFDQLVDSIINSTSELQELKSSFVNFINSKFTIEKLTNKIQNWYKYDFNDLLKELKKAKIKLTLSEEVEWMQFFNEQKQKAEALEGEINKIESEIDQMVYELYGLTEEEIRVVEGE